ncbi:glycosyltransferase [Nocardia sp. NPDC024068]|uniref:glycosyltransferase n=1 Tax=Nocardia sp. NPDC024068 TaxID=3157197 RepID=UPI003403F464
MSLPVISVIVPARITTAEGRAQLDEQLTALAGQDHTEPFEVIIADNGSRPGLETFTGEHPCREQLRMRYVAATRGSGASYARNVGAEAAAGSVLLFCDHDDRVYPQWIRRLTEHLESGYDLASSAVEGDTLNTADPRTVAPIAAPEHFQPAGVRVPILVGCSMACRKDVYLELGGLDTGYPANEDIEFGWRAARHGYRVGFVQAALVAYRYRPDFRSGYRQGIARGRGLTRLHTDFPGNGLPVARFFPQLRWIAQVLLARNLASEERGLLLGLAIGQLRGPRPARAARAAVQPLPGISGGRQANVPPARNRVGDIATTTGSHPDRNAP